MRQGYENTSGWPAVLADYGPWLYVLIGGFALLVLALVLAVKNWQRTGDRDDFWHVIISLPSLILVIALLILLDSGPRYVSVPLALVIVSIGASYLIATAASRLLNHCWDTGPVGLFKHFGVLVWWAFLALSIIFPAANILSETSRLLLVLAILVGWMAAPFLVRSMVDWHQDRDEDKYQESKERWNDHHRPG